MSAKYSFKAWETPCDNHTQKIILLKLADNANDEGMSWYSVAKIARDCNCSTRTVQRHIRELVKRGYLSVRERHQDNGYQSSNVYQLLIHNLVENKPQPSKIGGDILTQGGDTVAGGGDTVTPDPYKDPKRDPKKKRSPHKPPKGPECEKFTNERGNELTDRGRSLFETLWQAWPNKKNRKAGEKAFIKFIRANAQDPVKATSFLCNDVHQRLTMQQLGFGKMHLATYLNGSRWTDSTDPELG